MGNRIVWAVALVIAVVAAVSGAVVAVANPIPTTSVYFATEDFSLDKAQKDALDALLPQLETATAVTVDGYVQRSIEANKSKGPANLSFKRADAVIKYLQDLVKQRSQNKQEIVWTEAGKGQPFTGYWSPDARRAEVFIR
jgi:outer membrane protein OmpA-like peptidoglycan-associated protein